MQSTKSFKKALLVVAWLCTQAIAQNQIAAVKVLGDVSSLEPNSKAWLSAPYTTIRLYTKNGDIQTKNLRLKALHNAKYIAFLLSWQDNMPMRFDGFALQFSINFDDANKLPYIYLGNSTRSVLVHQRINTEQFYLLEVLDLQQFLEPTQSLRISKKQTNNGATFLASGFDVIEQKEHKNIHMYQSYQNANYKAVLSKPLQSDDGDLLQSIFSLSFLLLDQSSKDTKPNTFISPWIGIKLMGIDSDDVFLKSSKTPIDGDIIRGKELALQNCAVCHHFDDAHNAPQNIAPDLSHVSNLTNIAYLKESILQPSAVITPTSNANANFPWFYIDDNGQNISTMPAFDWMDTKSLEDVIAYFASLKF
ncbi:MAG: c-type cytochrome [Sulfurospirillum sp.]|nr:c-type cytochrome [Sulfurospirillum sp.]